MIKLRRTSDGPIGGVCGGIAKYMDVDPVIVRIIWGVAFFAYGFGGLAYVILWLALDKE